MYIYERTNYNEKIHEIIQNEHIKKFINKYYVIVLSIAVILFGAFYNYGLRMAFIPNAEDLLTISICYKTMHLGSAYTGNHDLLYGGIGFLSTLLGGMSFFPCAYASHCCILSYCPVHYTLHFGQEILNRQIYILYLFLHLLQFYCIL